MARTPHITAEMLLEAGAAITLEKGADALNVRSVAAKLNCSVQPVFRNFGSMETFRRAVIEYLDGTYQSFIAQYLDKSDYLFTISLAHILLARDRRNLFGVLFLSNEYAGRQLLRVLEQQPHRAADHLKPVEPRGHRLHGGAVRAHGKGSRSRLSRCAVLHVRHRRSAVCGLAYRGGR